MWTQMQDCSWIGIHIKTELYIYRIATEGLRFPQNCCFDQWVDEHMKSDLKLAHTHNPESNTWDLVLSDAAGAAELLL